MNRAMMARLGRLESIAPPTDRLSLIEVVFINPDRTEIEPIGFRDYDGGVWRREPDETLEAFRSRAGDLARKAPKRGIGVLIPVVREPEYSGPE